jgi:hypothetical protein
VQEDLRKVLIERVGKKHKLAGLLVE